MIVQRLNKYLNNTFESEIDHVIANYIKQNLKKIPDMKIEELAKRCYVSTGKISTFCKQLGYESFRELRNDCRHYSDVVNEVRKSQETDLEISYHQHLQQSFESMLKCLDLVDTNKLNKFVKLMNDTQNIYVYGGVYSNLLCHYFQYECEVLGKNVIVMDEQLAYDYDISEGDLLLVLTIEGYSFIIDKQLLRKINMHHCHRWVISTDLINKQVKSYFEDGIFIPANNVNVKEKRLMIRYLIDILLGRFQYLYVNDEKRDRKNSVIKA